MFFVGSFCERKLPVCVSTVGKGSVMLARVQLCWQGFSQVPLFTTAGIIGIWLYPHVFFFRLVRARWGMCPISRGRISFITNFPDTKFRLVRLGTPWWEKEPTTTRPAGGCDSYRAIADSCRQHQHVACYDRSVLPVALPRLLSCPKYLHCPVPTSRLVGPVTSRNHFLNQR